MAKAKSALTCGCPVAAFQKMISGKYKLRIVWDLKDGPLRYGEIKNRPAARLKRHLGNRAPRAQPRIEGADRIGADRPQGLRRRSAKVEYRLTRKGKSFVPVIAAIRDWGTAPSRAGERG